MSKMRRLTFLVLVLAVCAQICAAQELGFWTFDTDSEGWIDKGGPAINVAGFEASDGNPPGSVFNRDQILFPEPDCFATPTSRTVTVSADAKRPLVPSEAVCVLAIEAFTGSVCTLFGGTVFVGPLERPGIEWEKLETSLDIPSGFSSFRPYIFGGSINDFSVCLFDNISVSVAAATPPIPTLEGTGLLILGGLVAMVGLVVLRLRHVS